MTTRTILLTAAGLAALSTLYLSMPARALPAPGGTAPSSLTAEHDNWVRLARGGGGRGGGGGMRGGGGGMRGGGGFSGGAGRGSFGGGAGGFSGGSRDVRSSASSNVNFAGGNRNINNANLSNRNINNVNVNNINGACRGGCGGWGNGWDHPVAAAAAIGTAAAVTAAAVGSVAYSIPPDCAYINSYYQCGSTWYQPQYAGTNVQYVVVNAPQ